MLKGNNKRPDILIVESNVSPVCIETEIMPASTVEKEAKSRLGEKLRRSGKSILSSIAVIPTVIDQNPCAHLRMPRDMIFHGWSMRLFQAWQHSATMSS